MYYYNYEGLRSEIAQCTPSLICTGRFLLLDTKLQSNIIWILGNILIEVNKNFLKCYLMQKLSTAIDTYWN